MTTMGEESAENCDEFGWQPRGDIDPTLVAETTTGTKHGYGRAWSRTSTYSLRPDERLLYLVHTVEGGFDFTVEGVTVRTEPGQMIAFDGGADVHAQTITDTARYVWFFPATRLRPGRSLLTAHEPIVLVNAPMLGLVSMTNALLNNEALTSPSAHEKIGSAMENMLLAALDEEQRITEESAIHRDGLFTVAQSVIRSRFADPGFGVSELARELSTSRSHLHRAFMSMGTTPRREIERYRLAEVERMRALAPALNEIVEMAGFSSMRQYRLVQARNRGTFAIADA